MPKEVDGVYKRPNSKYYWASFIDERGQRVRRSTKCIKKGEAEVVRAKWLATINENKVWGRAEIPTFDEMMLCYMGEKNISPSMKSAIKHLYLDLTGTSADASKAMVHKFIQKHLSAGRSPATINKMLVIWCAAINLYNRKYSSEIPNRVSGEKLREGEGIIRFIDHDEAELLIQKAYIRRKHLGDAVTLALFTGLRRNELFSLKWSYINRGSIVLPAMVSKTQKSRVVPLVTQSIKTLDDIEHNGPYVLCNYKGERFKDMKKSFKAALEDANIENFRWHDLRHTFASWLVMAGTNILEVRDLLGHADVRTTQRYAHLAPDHLRKAVSVLPSFDSARCDANVTQSSHTQGDLGRFGV